MFSLLTLVTALLVAAAAEAADTLVKAKLHARRNYGLCVGLSDGTYNRNIVLRNCNHESAIWVIRDNEGDTFIRHRNVCLNGAWFDYDGGFHVGIPGPTYGQYCQDEALRDGWNLWNGVNTPWRWTRRPDGQFQLFGFPLHPCLDLKDGKLYDGAKLQIWDCHQKGHADFDNQSWNIEFLGPQYP